MNNTLPGIKWVKMPAAMFLTHLSVSAKLIRMLNLAYCMSLYDSSFGTEGQKRELLDLKKRASARASNCENIFYHMKQRGEQTTQGIPFSLISRSVVFIACLGPCLVFGNVSSECYHLLCTK